MAISRGMTDKAQHARAIRAATKRLLALTGDLLLAVAQNPKMPGEYLAAAADISDASRDVATVADALGTVRAVLDQTHPVTVTTVVVGTLGAVEAEIISR